MSEQDLQPVFSIEKIYVKDLSLEIPHAPQIFLEREQPEIDMQLATEGKQLEDGVFEAVITVTVTAKLGEKVMFLVEAAHVQLADENLRHGAPAGDAHHVLALFWLKVHTDFIGGDALARQQALGHVAVRAHAGAIQSDGFHCNILSGRALAWPAWQKQSV